ncbi:MAG TPA: peptidylprolyl isomerase [Pyrinomonadaceae bacterium]|nr:peptidylprolyl isomerase [Pyrinomonadaceae bacterium]
MKSTTKAIIAVAFAVAVAAGLIFWQAKGGFARPVTMTAEDMSLLVESMPPQAQMALSRSEEERKEFAKNIREMLALAEEGRKQGLADKPEVKRQIELMRQLVISRAYMLKQQEGGKAPDQIVPKEEIEAFLKEPGQDAKFNEFVDDVKKAGLIPEGTEISEEQKTELREDWARTALMSRKAVAEKLDQDPKVKMQLRLQEAFVIAKEYSKEQGEKLKATEEEVNAYIAAHPELDPSKAREKAEQVLQRVKGGEDFAKLAGEFSSDPGSKDKGGDLGWFGKGRMMQAFEAAAFALQPGQISDLVETPYGFHIIKVEERGQKPGADGKSEEQVRARHILIQQGGQANMFGMPTPPQDQARAAIQEEKRKKHIEELLKRTKINVAENFNVKQPQMPQMPQMPGMPPGAEGQAPPAGGEQPAPQQQQNAPNQP